MSLLALLATGAGAPITPDLDPVRAAIVAQLDPANYGGRVFTVGTDHATVLGTVALADAASSPGNWSLVLIPPGTYAERLERPKVLLGQEAYTDICSTTLDPADVVITPPSGTDDTLEHHGIGGIVAGITFCGVGGYSAIHSGDWGKPYDFIYYKVRAEQLGTNAAFSFGTGPEQNVYAYDCVFHGADGGVFGHNFKDEVIGAYAHPSRAVFDNCAVTGVEVPKTAWHMPCFDSGQADEFYIKGGSIDGPLIFPLGVGETASTYIGGIDPAITSTVSIAPEIGITRTLPAELPTPARLAAWLA